MTRRIRHCAKKRAHSDEPSSDADLEKEVNRILSTEMNGHKHTASRIVIQETGPGGWRREWEVKLIPRRRPEHEKEPTTKIEKLWRFLKKNRETSYEEISERTGIPVEKARAYVKWLKYSGWLAKGTVIHRHNVTDNATRKRE